MKKTLFTLIISLLVVVGANAESIGTVVKVKGEVIIVNEAGESTPAKALSELPVGSKLSTGPGAYAKLIMKDDTVFQVGPNSDFALEEFDFKTKNERKAVYSLAKGQLRSWFVHKSKDKTLTIKTPTASMGIRGTEILTDVYNENGKSKTDIALVRGKLEVSSKALGQNIILLPGQLLDNLGDRIKGRAPASAKKAHLKNLSQRVFQALNRNSTDSNGAIFLNDARSKFGSEKLNLRNFNKVENKAEPTRKPASNNPSNVRPMDTKVPSKAIEYSAPSKEKEIVFIKGAPIGSTSIIKAGPGIVTDKVAPVYRGEPIRMLPPTTVGTKLDPSAGNIEIKNTMLEKMNRNVREKIQTSVTTSTAAEPIRSPANTGVINKVYDTSGDGSVFKTNIINPNTGQKISLPSTKDADRIGN